MSTSFLPALSQSDVDRAAQLIQEAYSPRATLGPAEQRRLQQELFEIQRRPEAWGLVVPFLGHHDENVQFFGAHTAQVKIARDWDSVPQDAVMQLRDLLLQLTTHAIVSGRNRVILRKLFVAITSLALKIIPSRNPQWQWDGWILFSASLMSSGGVPTEHLLDFLAIVAQELETVELLGATKMKMHQTLLDAAPMVVQAIVSSINQATNAINGQGQRNPRELDAALKCMQSWVYILRGDDLTPLIPLLIGLLTPPASGAGEMDETTFVPASDALQEIMSKSALAGGSGTSTLTEPLLLWCTAYGARIVQRSSEFVDAVAHSFCKLLVALGDHSTPYFASHIVSPHVVSPSPPASPHLQHLQPQTRAHLIQTFLRLLMGYTGLPGYYGADEDASEMTLGFWYLFQEALWSVEFDDENDENDEGPGGGVLPRSRSRGQGEEDMWSVVRAVYDELVRVLRRKVVWPRGGGGWAKDQVDKFLVYRRDVGDTLINAYYILRNDMLAYYLKDLQHRLSQRTEQDGWEEIEATLHCIMSIQEAVPLEDNVRLVRLFGEDMLGLLPTTGQDRVRRTMLGLIGTYASWFTTQPSSPTPTPTSSSSGTSPQPGGGLQQQQQPSLLMRAVAYVASALTEPALCLPAANALRDLCDANRAALAPHIGAFAELHASLVSIPDMERAKVLQSIASVIQALPPEEAIPPVQAVTSPIVEKLVQALQGSSQLPEEARALAIVQLQTLTGVAKGLTRTTDALLILDEPSSEEVAAVERLERARTDPRMVEMREAVYAAVRDTLGLWSADAGIGDATSDLFRSLTALPTDITLLSLPPGPLLELVCAACERQITGTWLALASMLLNQLDVPSVFPFTAATTSGGGSGGGPLKSGPSDGALALVGQVLPVLLRTALTVLGQPGGMDSNPDIVQAFFGSMDVVATRFVVAFYRLPPGALDALIGCALGGLGMQERYSVAATCTFLGALIKKTGNSDALGEENAALIGTHGRRIMRALLEGFAGVAPRSATANLIEVLSAIVTKHPAEARVWMDEILFADDFVDSKASPEAKRAFVKAVVGSVSRSPRRTKEAAQQFALVARGLEGTSFGYASAAAL